MFPSPNGQVYVKFNITLQGGNFPTYHSIRHRLNVHTKHLVRCRNHKEGCLLISILWNYLFPPFYAYLIFWYQHKIYTNLERVREKENFKMEAKYRALSISLARDKAWNSIIMLPGNLENIALIKQKLSGIYSQWTPKQHYIILHSIIKAWTADTWGQSTPRKQKQMYWYK